MSYAIDDDDRHSPPTPHEPSAHRPPTHDLSLQSRDPEQDASFVATIALFAINLCRSFGTGRAERFSADVPGKRPNVHMARQYGEAITRV
jgi:hypothetical protein